MEERRVGRDFWADGGEGVVRCCAGDVVPGAGVGKFGLRRFVRFAVLFVSAE